MGAGGGKSWSLVRPLWDIARGHGLDATRLADVLGAAPGDDDQPVPIAGVLALWAHVATATRDDGLPFRAAATVCLEALGPLGLASGGLAPGYLAFEETLRYLPLIASSGRWHAEAREGLVHVSWVRGGERWLGHRLANESGVAQFIACLRQIYGAGFTPTEVRFRHGAPRRVQPHRAFFQAPVAFGEAADGFSFSVASLVPREPTSEARARGLVAANDARLAAQREGPGAVSHEVRLALDHRLGRGSGDLSAEPRLGERDIARAVGLSERSLRRKLAEEGTQFRRLVADARRDSAHVWLACSSVPLFDVAQRVGFADAAAFSHAVRRWFGRTPREIRARARAGAIAG